MRTRGSSLVELFGPLKSPFQGETTILEKNISIWGQSAASPLG